MSPSACRQYPQVHLHDFFEQQASISFHVIQVKNSINVHGWRVVDGTRTVGLTPPMRRRNNGFHVHASVRENLLNQAYRFANLADHELVENGLSKTLDFAPFRVSSAALTVGFMNALGIDSLRAIEVNMAGGILLESDFWSSQR